jgi:hypothetical protein
LAVFIKTSETNDAQFFERDIDVRRRCLYPRYITAPTWAVVGVNEVSFGASTDDGLAGRKTSRFDE